MAVKSSTARVTAADVQEILDTTLEASVINAFINTANTFIEVNLSSANLGEAMLTEIEKWLAAHFLSLRDRRVKSENIAGEYSVTYEVGNLGKGLMSTTYGQTAVALDTSGTLGSLNMKRASLKVF